MALSFVAPSLIHGGFVIALDPTTTSYTMADIYSRWKDWARDSNPDQLWAPPAFDVVGGDDLGGGKKAPTFYFLRNDLGWRFERPEADIEVTIDGNLIKRDPAGRPLFVGPATANVPVINVVLTNVATDNILASVVDGTLTVKQAFSIIVAATAGKGGPDVSDTYRYRDPLDLYDRVTATTDAEGVRTGVTYDLTGL
jgi:hypothetical protein